MTLKDTTAGGVEAIDEAVAAYTAVGSGDTIHRLIIAVITHWPHVRPALTPPATGDGAGAADISAAARILDAAGRHHGWWKGATYDDLDKISKDEFDDIVAAIIKAASPAPAPAARVDLVERCREIISWHDTGLLTGAALRAFAERSGFDLEEHDALIRAENKTAREAMEFIIAVSIPPAGETGNE